MIRVWGRFLLISSLSPRVASWVPALVRRSFPLSLGPSWFRGSVGSPTMLRRSQRTAATPSYSSVPDPIPSATEPRPATSRSEASATSLGALQTPPRKRPRRAPVSTTPDLCPDAAPSSAATISVATGWCDLQVPPPEFRPSATLTTGQSFHWSVVADPAIDTAADKVTSAWGVSNATDWMGTLRVYDPVQDKDDALVVHVREIPTTTLYQVRAAPPTLDVPAYLRAYFQLDIPLVPLYEEWSAACPRLCQIAPAIPGVRILQQDPWETLLTFLASSNNNIPRITKILTTLRQTYGRPIAWSVDNNSDEEEAIVQAHSFPSLQTLREQVTEADLRRLGWGYRAKYVVQTMEILHQLGGEAYLWKLREESDPAVVQQALLQFAGVGRKVADCVALFSLGQTRAIPVDVHVWQIALRDYDPTLATIKSLTPTIYNNVGDIFRDRFGDYAGWAHSLLFVAELPSFRSVLPPAVVQEMEDFAAREQARKRALKQAKKETEQSK